MTLRADGSVPLDLRAASARAHRDRRTLTWSRMSETTSSMLSRAFALAAMLTNMIADTIRARFAASTSARPSCRRRTAAIAICGTRGDREGFAVPWLGGVAEGHLSQVAAAVVDVDAVALDDRPDDGHDRVLRPGHVLGIRATSLEGLGVVRVLHEQQEFTLGLGVEEQCPGADVGFVGDLLGCDLVDAVLGEELARGSDDAVKLVLLVPLATSDGLVDRQPWIALPRGSGSLF